MPLCVRKYLLSPIFVFPLLHFVNYSVLQNIICFYHCRFIGSYNHKRKAFFQYDSAYVRLYDSIYFYSHFYDFPNMYRLQKTGQ